MGACEGNYVKWIQTIFGECVITTRDKWSFAMGMISNLIWIISSSPQMVQNCRTRIVEGQSPFFFSLLFTGNVLSLVGLLINGGLVTQYITSTLYVLLDGFLFLQFVMYTYCCPPTNSEKTKHMHENPEEPEENETIEDGSHSQLYIAGSSALLTAAASAKTDFATPYNKSNIVGTIFGWCGALIYLGSRIPQVVKNIKSKKVRDLSPFYVILAICGNGTYALSLFIKSTDGSYLWSQAPWIVGCFGPMSCDVIFLIQMCIYGYEITSLEKIEKKSSGEEEDLSESSEERRLAEL